MSLSSFPWTPILPSSLTQVQIEDPPAYLDSYLEPKVIERWSNDVDIKNGMDINDI